MSKSSLTNVDSTRRLFMKHDLFIRNEVANSTFFKPNLENDETVKLFEFLEVERRKVFYSKNKTIARLLKKYADIIIERSGKRVQMLVLFGSVARGEWTNFYSGNSSERGAGNVGDNIEQILRGCFDPREGNERRHVDRRY